MGRYKMVVMSDAVEGKEEEYNDWYTNQHVGDTLAVPGFLSGQRFKLHSVAMGEVKTRYLAIYTMESDDPDAALAEAMRRGGTDLMPVSDALDQSVTSVALYEEYTEEKVSSHAAGKS